MEDYIRTLPKTGVQVYNRPMKAAGVIAEYNPFHNGHGYLLRKAGQAAGADYVIAAMSGSFVQRGEPAMFDRRTRAKWALKNGADMVIYLPAPFSLASAEAFAMGGISLIAGTGAAEAVVFGSECGDTELLISAARLLDEEPQELKAALRSNLSAGLSYPHARAKAFRDTFGGGYAAPLFSPNDILGMEYIRAVNRLGAGLTPTAVKRAGPARSGADCAEGFAAASEIRRRILSSGADSIAAFVPPDVYGDIADALDSGRAPVTAASLSPQIVYALRRMTKRQLSRLPDVGEGLENLLYSACRRAADADGLLALAKSRRYTLARLKRICMCALLGIYGAPGDRLDSLYIHVAGLRREALPLLSAIRDRASLPVITRKADLSKLNEKQAELFRLDALASDIAALGTPRPSPAKFEFSEPFLIV